LAKVLSYDSAYIALAENLGLPLITADEKQANAAQSVGAIAWRGDFKMRFSPPLQVLERGPGGEVSESPGVMIRLILHWRKISVCRLSRLMRSKPTPRNLSVRSSSR